MRFLIAILVLLYSNIVFGKECHEIRSLFVESTARNNGNWDSQVGSGESQSFNDILLYCLLL